MSIVFAWLCVVLVPVGWLCAVLKTSDAVWAPIFFAALLAFVAAVVFEVKVRRMEKRRKGICGKCGYDRAGLGVGAKCPECGVAPVEEE